jgi:hypothetical protein
MIPVRAPEFFGDRIIGYAERGTGAMRDSFTVDLTDDEALALLFSDDTFIHNLSIEGEDL